ncbi:MAG: M24 family metallopeptidase [Rhizobiaceae bacterium]
MKTEKAVFAARSSRAVALLRHSELGAVAFVPGANLTYLTGVHLHLMERPTLFVLTQGADTYAVIPALEHQKWSTAMPDAETFYWDDAEGPQRAFRQLAQALGSQTLLGVEGLRMRAAEYISLAQHWPDENLRDADSILTELRMLKDAEEIAELRKAISISEAALGEVFEAGLEGRTERSLVADLKIAMLSHGADGFAFDPIVLTGDASANPHGDPGDRKIEKGQPLLVDFGASYGDMNADITRTVFCDHVRDHHAEIFETVQRANEAGRDAVKTGNPVGAIDTAATAILNASPFADMILHKTGHGLGREVHEAPQVMQNNQTLQQSGMVVTIEPGLYRPGDIGVRIEDDVLITDSGADSLTNFTRDLLVFA